MKDVSLVGKDIGNVLKKGSITVVDNGYDVTAGGADIWEENDEFYFAYTEQTGDFDFATRIESLSAPHLYTKGGVMARESLESDSKHVYMLVFPDNSSRNKNNGGCEFQYRNEKGGISVAIYPSDFITQPPMFPVNFPETWIRLKRTGNEFIAYYSVDGSVWKEYGRHTLEMNSKLYVGLAVTSHNNDEIAVASFREISIK